MAVDPTTTKFVIKSEIHADGVVDKSDIIGAIFGQTEGLLGTELDMRDLQKSARIGRIEVDVEQKSGKTDGMITVPSALEKVESALLAAGLETIDRIGPAKAKITTKAIEDARSSRREFVRARAKELLQMINEDPSQDSSNLLEDIKGAVHVAEITNYGRERLPAGPNVKSSESIIIVEGRSDVLNLLKAGIRNAIGVEGTNVPKAIQNLSKDKTTTIFIDGDRGGELIARELLETCNVDFVARAPKTREVEELPHKLMMKCLQNKMTADQFISQLGITIKKRDTDDEDDKKSSRKPAAKKGGRSERTEKSDKKPARRAKKSDDESDERPRGRKPAAKKSEDRDEERDEKPRDDRQRERKPAAKRAPAKKDDNKERKAAHDPRAGFRDSLAGLSGSLKAIILDPKGAEIKADLPVRELADTLKSTRKKVQSVVFDGVITQRLLDIAADKSIATVVGVKMGNVSKVPADVEILTRDDLN